MHRQHRHSIDEVYRAWMFAAGLVLGFSSLSEGRANADVQAAFRSSQSVLRKFGQLSAQADQYYRILTSFSDTVDAYWAQVDREQQQNRTPLVERIFSLSNQTTHPDLRGKSPDTPRPAPNATAGAISEGFWQSDDAIISLSSLLPDSSQWLPFPDDEAMLQMLCDNATSVGDPVP